MGLFLRLTELPLRGGVIFYREQTILKKIIWLQICNLVSQKYC
jgi:hypothetical protein